MTPITRNKRFTLRLSDDEKAELEQLSDHLNLDKSATVRQALKLLSARNTRLQVGVFTTIHQQHIPIQFNHKESNEFSS